MPQILNRLILSCMIVPALLWADDFRNWSNHSGLNVFAFQEQFQGPRATAMAQAGGSLPTTDIFSVLLNPALLQKASYKHYFGFAGETGSLDRDMGLLAWNFGYQDLLFQTTYAFTQSATIDGLDENGVATNQQYKPFSQSITLTSTIPFPHFYIGLSTKYIRDHLSNDPGDQDAMGIGADWGLVWRSPSPRYGFGLAVLDLGRQFRAYTEDGVDDLALNTRVRASTHYRPAAVRGLTFLLDAELPRYVQPSAHLGLEYSPISWLQLRGGLQRTLPSMRNTVNQIFSGNASDEDAADTWNLGSLGFGVHWQRYTLDYSILILRDGVGQFHKLGLSTGF